jgi:putative membrane protein insertion efficiency factor
LSTGLGVRAIRAYQLHVSSRRPSRCVFEPTCSHYAVLAIERQGLLRGGRESLRRLWRCRAENIGVVDYPGER